MQPVPLQSRQADHSHQTVLLRPPPCLAPYHTQAQTMSEDDARQELCYVLLTVKTAQNFAKALHDDMLPSSEIEEHIWGLYGQPRSPGYQRLLV